MTFSFKISIIVVILGIEKCQNIRDYVEFIYSLCSEVVISKILIEVVITKILSLRLTFHMAKTRGGLCTSCRYLGGSVHKLQIVTSTVDLLNPLNLRCAHDQLTTSIPLC